MNIKHGGANFDDNVATSFDMREIYAKGYSLDSVRTNAMSILYFHAVFPPIEFQILLNSSKCICLSVLAQLQKWQSQWRHAAIPPRAAVHSDILTVCIYIARVYSRICVFANKRIVKISRYTWLLLPYPSSACLSHGACSCLHMNSNFRPSATNGSSFPSSRSKSPIHENMKEEARLAMQLLSMPTNRLCECGKVKSRVAAYRTASISPSQSSSPFSVSYSLSDWIRTDSQFLLLALAGSDVTDFTLFISDSDWQLSSGASSCLACNWSLAEWSVQSWTTFRVVAAVDRSTSPCDET